MPGAMSSPAASASAIKVRVYVTLKADVLDPQGNAVLQALQSLGFDGVRSARVGKFIELEVDRREPAALRTELDAMGSKLLSNPVIEDFRYELGEV